MPIADIIRRTPFYMRIPFDTTTVADGTEASVTVTIPDNYLWMGIVQESTNHDMWALRIRDEDKSEYLPANGNYVVASAWCGVGRRPFWFPAPRLLRRNSQLKMELKNSYIGSDTTVDVVLLGLVVDEDMARDWACADMGYVAYANDEDSTTTDYALWRFAASAYTRKQLSMMTAADFGLCSITGYHSTAGGRNINMALSDPMNCPRDKSVVSHGFEIDVDLTPISNLIGTGEYPHYFLNPYPYMSQGAIDMEFQNNSATTAYDVGIMFHGAKLPRGNDDLLRKTWDWIVRYCRSRG